MSHPKKHQYTNETISIVTSGPINWLNEQLSLLPMEVVAIIVGFGHCVPGSLSPYNPPCTFCEPERVLTAVTAATLCPVDNCLNPVDTKAPCWVNSSGKEIPADTCAYCHVRSVRLWSGRFRLGSNGLGPTPAEGVCAVLNCGNPATRISCSYYPVCIVHTDKKLVYNYYPCPEELQVQSVYECDHTKRARPTVRKN